VYYTSRQITQLELKWRIDKPELWQCVNVAREMSIESAELIDLDSQVQVLITTMRIRNKNAATHVKLSRKDTNLSNVDQQGIWSLLEARCTHPLIQDPAQVPPHRSHCEYKGVEIN
jgi:hypothetical protein